MEKVRTPCIGICSTTSVGDSLCRGCKRYAFEVISWNSYSNQEKLAVLSRIERFSVQILENKVRIFSVPNLREGLRRWRIPFDETLSPYCWLHNLLKRGHQKITRLDELGVYLKPEFARLTLAELNEVIDRDLITLAEAHFDRYMEIPYLDRSALGSGESA
ncbi:MAG: DUF1289 domain-containing protein [Pseudohongiellaceae bacterium]